MNVRRIAKRALALTASAFVGLSVVSGCKKTHACVYDRGVAEAGFLKTEATCQSQAEYYYSCSCGKVGSDTFFAGELAEHDYSLKVPEGRYLKEEASFDAAAIYYQSCSVCGAAGEETFSYGEKLKEYTDEEKRLYTPTSLTLTLYDPENSVYGFTYNTREEPLRPVVQISKGNALSETPEEYSATVTQASSYDANDRSIHYFIVKAEVRLEPSTTYTYRAYDKYVGVGTAAATLQTKDTTATAFSFAHVSDSQVNSGTGSYFSSVLSQIVEQNDFILHTGDVVEYSKYESYWTDMLNGNFAYLSRIPMMTISGNHETTYRNGSNELFKHFHNKLPTQSSTEIGYFYSFVYGNAKFIMLNTNDLTGNKLKAEQYDWLVNELKNNESAWTIVAMHHPMYSLGKWGAGSSNEVSLALRTQLNGLFAQYGVDIVLQGHDHLVSRTFPVNSEGVAVAEKWQTINNVNYTVDPKGTIYVMNGPAGDQTKAPVATDTQLYKYADTSYACSWADIRVSGNYLTVTAKYYADGKVKVYRTWGIKKAFSANKDWSNWV